MRLLVASSLLLLALIACRRGDFHKEEQTPLGVKTSSLRAGDIVCRCGNGFWSRHFRDVSLRDKRFSHVGIVIVESGRILVLHASADDFTGHGTVHKEPLSVFLASARDAAVYRINGDASLGARISTEALSHLGKPFDAQFDLSSDDTIYCSELVRLAVNRIRGKNFIGTTWIRGKEVVAIDNCYPPSLATTVFDAKNLGEPARGTGEHKR